MADFLEFLCFVVILQLLTYESKDFFNLTTNYPRAFIHLDNPLTFEQFSKKY